MKTTKSARYYLHRKIKQKEIKYDSLLKTIYWNWQEPLTNKHVLRLRDEFNYTIQTEIN